MPTRIRLQRFGKKGMPYYRIVVADNRAPRDGRFIENLGTYNPLTVPATIDINAERALYWLQVGSQPSETARAILSYKGLIYKNHLLKGVKKGAITEEQAEAKFNAWLEEKQNKIANKIKEKEIETKESLKKKLQEEAKVSEDRAKAIKEKREKLLAKDEKANAEETTSEENNTEASASEETPAVDEVKVEEAPAVAEESTTTDEVKAEEAPAVAEESTTTDEVKAEETPAIEEAKVEEAPVVEETSSQEEDKKNPVE